jgi:hypothetical protein
MNTPHSFKSTKLETRVRSKSPCVTGRRKVATATYPLSGNRVLKGQWMVPFSRPYPHTRQSARRLKTLERLSPPLAAGRRPQTSCRAVQTEDRGQRIFTL